jgi:hypothetical protein
VIAYGEPIVVNAITHRVQVIHKKSGNNNVAWHKVIVLELAELSRRDCLFILMYSATDAIPHGAEPATMS